MTDPYFRAMQPDTPTSEWKDSSYFRLGQYIAQDEPAIVTGLTTTTSSNTYDDKHAIFRAESKIGTDSKTTDKERKVTNTKSSPITSDNKGLLAYTNADLQLHAKRAALMKFGAGHTTEVTTGDAKYSVKSGALDISALNGISLKASSKGGTPADIKIEASNSISQTAHGPLSEFVYGHSEKRTIGNAMEFFGGTKFTCMVGAETTMKLALSTSLFIGASFTFKLAFEFTASMAYSVTIRKGGSLTLTLSNKEEFIVGNDWKQVKGLSTKIVLGEDKKSTLGDSKVVTGDDLKVVTEVDGKRVTTNYGRYGFKDDAADVSLANGKTQADTHEIANSIVRLSSTSGGLFSVSSQLGFSVG